MGVSDDILQIRDLEDRLRLVESGRPVPNRLSRGPTSVVGSVTANSVAGEMLRGSDAAERQLVESMERELRLEGEVEELTIALEKKDRALRETETRLFQADAAIDAQRTRFKALFLRSLYSCPDGFAFNKRFPFRSGKKKFKCSPCRLEEMLRESRAEARKFREEVIKSLTR